MKRTGSLAARVRAVGRPPGRGVPWPAPGVAAGARIAGVGCAVAALGALLLLAAPGEAADPAGAPAAAADSTSPGTRAPRPAAPLERQEVVLQVDGVAGTQVAIDGRPIGTLPLSAPLALEPGNYLIEGERRGFMPLRQELSLHNGGEKRWLQLRLIPLSRRDAVLYSVALAGLGEHYVGRPLEGYLLSAAEIGGLLAALGGQLAYTNRRSDYIVLYDAYLHAVGDADLAAQRAAAVGAWQKLKDAESLRNTGLLVAAGAVVVGMLDVWLRFPSIEAGPGTTTLGSAGGGGGSGERAGAMGVAASGGGAPGGGPGGAPGGALAEPASAHLAWVVRF